MQCTKENLYFAIETLRRNDMNASEIYSMLSIAWPNDCLSERRIREVCQQMRDGERDNFTRKQGSGRKKSDKRMESVAAVQHVLEEDSTLSVQRISSILEIPHTMTQRILNEDLQKRWVATKWIPHNLTESNRAIRVERCRDLIEAFKSRQCLSNLISIDEKWFYCRNLQPKTQIGQWVSPGGDHQPLQTPRRTTMEKKFMAIIAVSQKGLHYFEIVPSNSSVNAERYIQFLENFFHFWSSQRPFPLMPENMRIIHDNAPPHTARSTVGYLQERNVRLLKQPPYSPDCNICDRYIFQRLEAIRKSDLNTEDELRTFLSKEMPHFTQDRMRAALNSMIEDLKKIIDCDGYYL